MRPNLGCHYQWLAFFQLEVTKRFWDKTSHEISFATLSFVSNCTPLTTFSSQESSFSIPIHWSLLLSIRESMCGSWLAPHPRSRWDWCCPTFMMSLILQHYSSTTQSKLHASIRKLKCPCQYIPPIIYGATICCTGTMLCFCSVEWDSNITVCSV